MADAHAPIGLNDMFLYVAERKQRDEICSLHNSEIRNRPDPRSERDVQVANALLDYLAKVERMGIRP